MTEYSLRSWQWWVYSWMVVLIISRTFPQIPRLTVNQLFLSQNSPYTKCLGELWTIRIRSLRLLMCGAVKNFLHHSVVNCTNLYDWSMVRSAVWVDNFIWQRYKTISKKRFVYIEKKAYLCTTLSTVMGGVTTAYLWFLQLTTCPRPFYTPASNNTKVHIFIDTTKRSYPHYVRRRQPNIIRRTLRQLWV